MVEWNLSKASNMPFSPLKKNTHKNVGKKMSSDYFNSKF